MPKPKPWDAFNQNMDMYHGVYDYDGHVEKLPHTTGCYVSSLNRHRVYVYVGLWL